MGKKSLLKSRRVATPPIEPTPLTFMGHIRELRRRLVWVVLWFVALSGVSFPFYHQLIQILMRPLGDEKLYFLSPIGGLSFAMKICMYVGLVAVLPIFIYNMYKFISPAVRKHSASKAIGYATLSMVLAAAGVVFAYLVTLPSAIYFLTHFDLGNISAMLTVDAYLSFIISYVLAGAILFQLPLIMVIVDNITPTPPSKWNKYQRHMIVAAFVIAMLITPVPDILNQFMLAAPIIVMYQFGIFLVWMRHRKQRPVVVEAAEPEILQPEIVAVVQPQVSLPQDVPKPSVLVAATTPEAVPATRSVKRSMDGFMKGVRPVRPEQATIVVPQRSTPTVPARPMRLATNIDGFFPAR